MMLRLAAVVLAAVVAIARPAAATPLPVAIERDGITLRAEAGLDGVAARLLGESASHLASIAADLPDLPTPRAIEIRVVVDAASMQDVSPGDRIVPPWAAGVAFPDLGLVVVATRRGPDLLDIDEVLHHELAHVALGAALGDRAPRWLHEGFAYQHSAEWTMARTETLAGMAWGHSVIPLAELDTNFPAQELPADRAYAESYDFVGYLAHRGRYEDHDDDGDRWPFRNFLGFIGHGDTPTVAAQRAFGRSLPELFDEWREDLGRRFLLIPAGVFTALLWIGSALLLFLAFMRRRRHNKKRLAVWQAEDDARAAWLATLDADLDDRFDDIEPVVPARQLPN